MPSISSFLTRNDLKRDACAWDRFNLVKLHELMADDKMKEGAVLYENTTRPWFGKAESFVSTREKTTSHGLFTPRGSKDKAALRLLETLNQKFADGRNYGPEVLDARDYLVWALSRKMAVVKDPQFLRAIHTVAYAKEIVPEPQLVAANRALRLQDRLDQLDKLVPGMTPTMPSNQAIETLNAQPDAVKQSVRALLQPTVAEGHKIDPDTRGWVIDVLIGLDAPRAPDSAPSVGDTSQAIGFFAYQLQQAAQTQLGYPEFAEIDEATTLGELLENINSRPPELKQAIKRVVLHPLTGVQAPPNVPMEWPQLFGHAHMSARVLAGIEEDAPADPYADIDGAELFDYPKAIEPMPPAIPSLPASTETDTYSSSSSEEYFGSLKLSR